LGDEGRPGVVTIFNGVVGGCSSKESLETPLDVVFESTELILVDRVWLPAVDEPSKLFFRGAVMLFVECPRPPDCGRDNIGEGIERAPLCDEVEDVD